MVAWNLTPPFPNTYPTHYQGQDTDLTILCNPRIIGGLDSAFDTIIKPRTFRMRKCVDCKGGKGAAG